LLTQHHGAASGASGATSILHASSETSCLMRYCSAAGSQHLFPGGFVFNGSGKTLHSCSTALNSKWYMHYKQNLSNV